MVACVPLWGKYIVSVQDIRIGGIPSLLCGRPPPSFVEGRTDIGKNTGIVRVSLELYI